ncbi:MAG: sterol desaturase family protein [Gemmatimonadota bacterium]
MAAGTAFLVLTWLEHRRPLRRPTESKLRHTARNLGVAAVSAVALQLAERPVTRPLAALVARRRWGVLHQAPLPGWARTALAVVLLDYTLYIWHVLVHRVPWLWRFHQVHHVDLDMDASTALRFHFGELVASVGWRAGQIVTLGVTPRALSIWQAATIVSILFHHSDVRLPLGFERWLGRLLVTPRMHAIHHSVVPDEVNSNWSSGLTLWDRLHGTLRLDVPQETLTIGVAAWQDPAELGLPQILAMPFESQRD